MSYTCGFLVKFLMMSYRITESSASASPTVFPTYSPTQPPSNLPSVLPSISPTPEVAEVITGIADPKNEMANYKHIGQLNNNNETQEEGISPSIKGTEVTIRIADPKRTTNFTITGQTYGEEPGAAETSVPSNGHNTRFGSREKRQGGSGATAFLFAAVVVVVALMAVDYRRQQRLETMLFHRELSRVQDGFRQHYERELAREEGDLTLRRPQRRFSKGFVRRQLEDENTRDERAGDSQSSSAEGLSQKGYEGTDSDLDRFDPGTAPSSFANQGPSILELSRQPPWRLSSIEGTGTLEDHVIADIAKLEDREKKTALEMELSQSTGRLLDSFHECLDASISENGDF